MINAQVVGKYIASFFKREWTLDNYPVELREQGGAVEEREERAERPWPRWHARVINWWVMGGVGATKEEALSNLQIQFHDYKATHRKLPRPGRSVEIEVAPRSMVEGHQQLADEFVQKVLGLEWALITDESSLADFEDETPVSELVGRIQREYHVDVSTVEGKNIATILQQIEDTRGGSR